MRPIGPQRAERSTAGQVAAVQAQLILVLTVVILQLWLLTVGLEALLAGNFAAVWSLAVFSGLGFLTALVALAARRKRL